MPYKGCGAAAVVKDVEAGRLRLGHEAQISQQDLRRRGRRDDEIWTQARAAVEVVAHRKRHQPLIPELLRQFRIGRVHPIPNSIR
jgi:hypothetical protein